ncbi:MAG: Unknown protein [uncultured Sulfurovum sp.]|uniref:Uncharacterized protein n=1 Tax=uncultured Sulfurovum sp. TaxID=269237 RepID=A0A6S6S8B8_9BACT|nr:MAG: Unknown protein [uncultured Sulfurovum sp.]
MIKMLFSIIWWFGFVVAIALMIGLYVDVAFIRDNAGGLFLLVGIQHMIVLVVLGFFAIRERADNIEVGNRVSTMGYLHTLIGTSVALILTAKYGSEVIEHVENIIAPIGSSLITSIIGWAFGKEMEREKYRLKVSTEEETNNALEFLAQKVTNSALLIERSSKFWAETIDKSTHQIHNTSQQLEIELKETAKRSEEMNALLSESFDNIYKKMEHNLEGISTVMERDLKNTSEYSQKIIKDSLALLEEQFKKIEQSSQLMKNQFERSSIDADKVFRNSIDTFDNGLNKMGDIAKEWDKHLKNMKRFSTHSDSAIDQLTHTSQKVIDEISTIAHTLPKAGEMLTNLDDFLANLKRKDKPSS